MTPLEAISFFEKKIAAEKEKPVAERNKRSLGVWRRNLVEARKMATATVWKSDGA